MINFYKYHGAGNDFIMINNLTGDIKLDSDYIKNLCDRHYGIGADGLILLESSGKADCFMNYYNSDGSIAEMCGNGVRCTALFYEEQTNLSKACPYSIEIETRAGVKKIMVHEDETYSVDMGEPVFESKDFPSLTDSNLVKIKEFRFSFVSMGNPHAVTIVPSLNEINIKEIGSKVENDSSFPNKINVEFVEKIDDYHYKVKVWERGCGETLACGTGACAVFSIINKIFTRTVLGKLGEETALEFPGGILYIREDKQGHIILRGPACFVFKGEIHI